MKTKTPSAPKKRAIHVGKKTYGGTSGALVGALVAGPVGALLGGLLGTGFGAAAEYHPAKRKAKTSAPKKASIKIKHSVSRAAHGVRHSALKAKHAMRHAVRA